MANVLKMAISQSIEQLHLLGWSQRRIARELGIDRGTVARYLRALRADPKPAISPPGSDESNAATFSASPAPVVGRAKETAGSDCDERPNAAISPLGSAGENGEVFSPRAKGRPSDCAAYRELIESKLNQGLSGQRIWQDLTAEHGFGGSYYSVKRFIRSLGEALPQPFRRLECAPGDEAQVDFGEGAKVVTADGKRRRTYVFRIVLSHSRKAYSEATFTQTTEDFFRCLENAFAHFGGVPKTLVVDNLKAAVAHPDWFDPILTPKVQAFCQHYGTVILPTKPYMPRHKGKVESGVKYVKNNALKARQFTSLDAENRCLEEWERTIADKRIHGTTKQQVGKRFEEVERSALLPRPLERFAFFHEAKRKVSRDGHVEVAKAYYSTPPEYLGREVWVRWDTRLVRIFNHRFEPIAVHARHEQGRFSTNARHVPREKISGLEKGVSFLLSQTSVVGTFTKQWSEAVIHARGVQGTRVLSGLLSLTKKHSCVELEKACETALSHGCWHLKTIRNLLGRGDCEKQTSLPFLEEHPVIRPLEDYGAIVARALQRQADRSSLSEGFERHDWTKTNMQEKSPPASSSTPAGSTELSPPRSSYPSPGCASAEPDSVSPDTFSVVRDPFNSTSQESSHE